MILSTFGLARDATLGDWMKAAGELNPIGGQVQKAGMQLGYHNHNMEFTRLDGVLVYDKLMSAFDPKLVKDAVSGSPAEKKEVPIGQGSVHWKKLFSAAKKSEVKNYFVEMNMEAMKTSFPYLHGLTD